MKFTEFVTALVSLEKPDPVILKQLLGIEFKQVGQNMGRYASVNAPFPFSLLEIRISGTGGIIIANVDEDSGLERIPGELLQATESEITPVSPNPAGKPDWDRKWTESIQISGSRINFGFEENAGTLRIVYISRNFEEQDG